MIWTVVVWPRSVKMLLSLDTTICTKSVDVLAREKTKVEWGRGPNLSEKQLTHPSSFNLHLPPTFCFVRVATLATRLEWTIHWYVKTMCPRYVQTAPLSRERCHLLNVSLPRLYKGVPKERLFETWFSNYFLHPRSKMYVFKKISHAA